MEIMTYFKVNVDWFESIQHFYIRKDGIYVITKKWKEPILDESLKWHKECDYDCECWHESCDYVCHDCHYFSIIRLKDLLNNISHPQDDIIFISGSSLVDRFNIIVDMLDRGLDILYVCLKKHYIKHAFSGCCKDFFRKIFE